MRLPCFAIAHHLIFLQMLFKGTLICPVTIKDIIKLLWLWVNEYEKSKSVFLGHKDPRIKQHLLFDGRTVCLYQHKLGLGLPKLSISK